MSVFMMRAAFTTLPKELEEAARIDGISEFGLFWKVMLPLVKPTMVTLIILGVNGAWNDLLWPLLITSSTDMRTSVSYTHLDVYKRQPVNRASALSLAGFTAN